MNWFTSIFFYTMYFELFMYVRCLFEEILFFLIIYNLINYEYESFIVECSCVAVHVPMDTVITICHDRDSIDIENCLHFYFDWHRLSFVSIN